jgi:hypothetical protein
MSTLTNSATGIMSDTAASAAIGAAARELHLPTVRAEAGRLGGITWPRDSSRTLGGHTNGHLHFSSTWSNTGTLLQHGGADFNGTIFALLTVNWRGLDE